MAYEEEWELPPLLLLLPPPAPLYSRAWRFSKFVQGPQRSQEGGRFYGGTTC